MRKFAPLLACLLVVSSATLLRAVDPVPESQQAALALKILDAYQGAGHAVHKKLHLVYFTPSDRDPEPRYQERLNAILEDIRGFYRDGMKQAGFGPETFDLDRDANGSLIIHLVKGSEPESAFPRSPGGEQATTNDARSRAQILRDCRPVLKSAGISLDDETVLIVCNLAKWDPNALSFSHHSPYCGYSTAKGGICFAVDSVILNADDIMKKEPILHDAEWGDESLGKFNTVFIGGVAHELGHAFWLPHCGERWDEVSRGKSLMGVGNHTYREERRGEGQGAFLAVASAMRLAANPLFSKSDRGLAVTPKIVASGFDISTNVSRPDLAGRPAALRLEGTVKGTPPVYGIIAYFDSSRTGGYDAPTATTVPDAHGRFAIEVSDLAPCSVGELRIQFCHANGMASEAQLPFRVMPDHTLDLGELEMMKALGPVADAVAAEDLKTARAELVKIEKTTASGLAKTIARNLVAALETKPKPVPADLPSSVTELALGNAQPESATVGWLKPSANRIPPNDEIPEPFLDSGDLYATGLFAHAPSSYLFDLGGKWKSLSGEAGLHTAKQSFGSVVFVIKADGREVFRSPLVRGPAKPKYEIDVTGVNKLELVVEDGGDGNANDWGLWLDPTLHR